MKNISKLIQKILLMSSVLVVVLIFATHTVHAQEWYGDDWIRDTYFNGQGFNFDGYQDIQYGAHPSYMQEYRNNAGDVMHAVYCSNGYWGYDVSYICYSSANVCGDAGSGTTGSQASIHNSYVLSGYSWGCNASTPDESGYGSPNDTGGGYQFWGGMYKRIVDRQGYRFCATNNTGNSYFVPTNSAAELLSFLNASGNLGVSIHW